MAWLVLLVVGALVLAPVLAAFALAPPGLLALWPVVVVAVAPALLGTLTALAVLTGQRLVPAPVGESAGAWLRRRVDAVGRGLRVATLDYDRARCRSFFHPASRTIVLGDDVHDEHTARAYATAAHELGHAVLHLDHPWLSLVLRGARAHASRCFQAGLALLAGSALVPGAAPARALAELILTASLIQALLVVVD